MQLFKKCILSLGNYSLTLEMLTIYIYIYVHIYIYKYNGLLLRHKKE